MVIEEVLWMVFGDVFVNRKKVLMVLQTVMEVLSCYGGCGGERVLDGLWGFAIKCHKEGSECSFGSFSWP